MQEPLLPGVQAGLIARNVSDLLRAGLRFCESVATAHQFAALEGVSTAKLTGREAFWQGGEKVPIIGPSVPAAWAGSGEEKQANEKLDAWTRHVGCALWGDAE